MSVADPLACLPSSAEGDDGEYHSPKSVSESIASGYFSATESTASGMPLRGGRAGPPPLLPTMAGAMAVGQAGRADESGASSNDEARVCGTSAGRRAHCAPFLTGFLHRNLHDVCRWPALAGCVGSAPLIYTCYARVDRPSGRTKPFRPRRRRLARLRRWMRMPAMSPRGYPFWVRETCQHSRLCNLRRFVRIEPCRQHRCTLHATVPALVSTTCLDPPYDGHMGVDSVTISLGLTALQRGCSAGACVGRADPAAPDRGAQATHAARRVRPPPSTRLPSTQPFASFT